MSFGGVSLKRSGRERVQSSCRGERAQEGLEEKGCSFMSDCFD
jgi:hypothetical protein